MVGRTKPQNAKQNILNRFKVETTPQQPTPKYHQFG